ncbi:hypothetical protein DTO039G3_3169 [Penicillium roqueforti]|nr:hypothetical protein DTO039G3_3169 [Penicillium roqueforti]
MGKLDSCGPLLCIRVLRCPPQRESVASELGPDLAELRRKHPLGADMVSNMSTSATWFTIRNSAPKVDLVAATANKTCPGQYGVAINMTDKTVEVPRGLGSHVFVSFTLIQRSIPF